MSRTFGPATSSRLLLRRLPGTVIQHLRPPARLTAWRRGYTDRPTDAYASPTSPRVACVRRLVAPKPCAHKMPFAVRARLLSRDVGPPTSPRARRLQGARSRYSQSALAASLHGVGAAPFQSRRQSPKALASSGFRSRPAAMASSLLSNTGASLRRLLGRRGMDSA